MSQLNISLVQTAINLDIEYHDTADSWDDSYTLCQKQFVSQSLLRWCKRKRAIFDLIEECDEPDSTMELDNWLDVKQYQDKWNDRVSLWRRRYNQAHS